jgi:LPS-assembly lipoprotein
MLSSKSAREHLVLFFLVITVGGLVGACGFNPLYGRHGTGVDPAEQYLARIQIEQIKDRIGQQLRNNLLARLNPKGTSAQPLYSLSITLSESISSLEIQKSARVTRGNLKVSAKYVVIRLDLNGEVATENATLTSGDVLATSSYNIPQAQYAAMAALKDAQTRAVKELADDIRTRLAVYFKQKR